MVGHLEVMDMFVLSECSDGFTSVYLHLITLYTLNMYSLLRVLNAKPFVYVNLLFALSKVV